MKYIKEIGLTDESETQKIFSDELAVKKLFLVFHRNFTQFPSNIQ